MAQVAKPQAAGGGNTLYMMQAPKKASELAKAQVQVVCVPDFTGMTLDQAKAAIEKTKGISQIHSLAQLHSPEITLSSHRIAALVRR